MRRILIVIFLLISGTIFMNNSIHGKKHINNVKLENEKCINPVNLEDFPMGIEYNSGEAEVSNKLYLQRDYSEVINSVKDIVSNVQGSYGIYFISLINGQSFGINDMEQCFAASTVKLPVNLYLFDKFSKGELDPEATITYLEEDFEEGCGEIQYEDIGNEYTLRELSRLSIELSDNIAINMLIRYLDRDKIYDFEEKIVGRKLERDGNLSTARDMALYLQELVNFSSQYPKEGEELIEYLKNTEFNDRIPLYLPPDVEVAHKIGNGIGAIHDVGIIYAEKPYILSVMTKEADEQEAYEAIARISRMVYDFEHS